MHWNDHSDFRKPYIWRQINLRQIWISWQVFFAWFYIFNRWEHYFNLVLFIGCRRHEFCDACFFCEGTYFIKRNNKKRTQFHKTTSHSSEELLFSQQYFRVCFRVSYRAGKSHNKWHCALIPHVNNKADIITRKLDLFMKNIETAEWWAWSKLTINKYRTKNGSFSRALGGFLSILKIGLGVFTQSAIASLYIKITILCAPIFILIICRNWIIFRLISREPG